MFLREIKNFFLNFRSILNLNYCIIYNHNNNNNNKRINGFKNRRKKMTNYLRKK